MHCKYDKSNSNCHAGTWGPWSFRHIGGKTEFSCCDFHDWQHSFSKRNFDENKNDFSARVALGFCLKGVFCDLKLIKSYKTFHFTSAAVYNTWKTYFWPNSTQYPNIFRFASPSRFSKFQSQSLIFMLIPFFRLKFLFSIVLRISKNTFKMIFQAKPKNKSGAEKSRRIFFKVKEMIQLT